MNFFKDALSFVLEAEGGYSNHKNDRGGATNRGVTQATYDKWRGAQGFPPNAIKFITDGEVETIYHDLYWKAAHCDTLSQPMATIHFDSSVQHGPGRAMKFLQSACGVPVDGKWGPKTAKALEDIGQIEVTAYLDARRDFYDDIIQNDPSQAVFAKGWYARLGRLELL